MYNLPLQGNMVRGNRFSMKQTIPFAFQIAVLINPSTLKNILI